MALLFVKCRVLKSGLGMRQVYLIAYVKKTFVGVNLLSSFSTWNYYFNMYLISL